MNDFFQKFDKYYKLVSKIAFGVLAGIVTIGAGYGLAAIRATAGLFGAAGWYTFLLVIYWLAVIAAVLCVVYKVAEFFVRKNSYTPNRYIDTNANYNQQAAQQNYYNQQQGYQQNYNQQAAQQGYQQQAQQQQQGNASADSFCSNCGAKVPAGNSFCPSCGNKL